MVKSKKLLSLFLAVVMTLSVCSVMAFAYTVGPEVDGALNVKYTVEKATTVPETAAGSAEYTADNIYAVSVWMQCDYAVEVLTAPLHFDKTLFAPIMLFDGEVTYPAGAGFGVDDYYDNMTEGTLYAYAEGDYLNNTGMYKADGSTATTKALAKCIGLGNSNSAGVAITAELVGPGHPLYSKWGEGLPDNTGVMYVNLDVASTAKTAYLNTISGITTSTDWNKMFTFYFETLDGVTPADIAGAEFGVYTDDCFTVDGSCDKNAGYFVSATARQSYNPDKNVVSNAVIEVAAGPEVVALDDTMARMDVWSAAETTNTFDGGLIGQINNAALTFTDGECNEIESIEVYANGQKMGNAYQVYKVNDTTYQFRAVILNMDKTADTYATDVEYEFRVAMKGDYADSGVLTATKTVSAQTIFTEAYDNYKAANA